MFEPRAPWGPFGHRRAPDVLPDDAAERFEFRVLQLMQSSGQSRTWCRQRVREMYPDEWAARVAAR